MSNHSTYDDANLILRLYELRREERMRAARKWYMESFGPDTLAEFRQLCPAGSDTNASFRQVSTYYEMVSSFVTGGVLNEELYFQAAGELFLVYLRIEPFLADLRTAFKNPGMYKNLEIVAKKYAAYIDKNDPDASAAFRARMRAAIGK
jgi:hypothetical protein